MRVVAVRRINEITRQNVRKRQDFRSITGIWLGESGGHMHHFISRGRSGVGFEWNLILMTDDEHQQYHNGGLVRVNGTNIVYTHEEFTDKMRDYLISQYDGWSEERCRFHKFWEYKDYKVQRKGNL